MSGDAKSAGTSGLSEILPAFAPRFLSLRPLIMASCSVEAMASSMETVASATGRRCHRKGDPFHTLQAHEDEEVNSVLSSFAQVDVDDTPISE